LSSKGELTWWDANKARVVLVARFAALVVLIHGFGIVAASHDGLCSHCGRKDSDQCRLRKSHDSDFLGSR
jgi:hypothetical protein